MKSYKDGNLILEKEVSIGDGKGKCPFDPFQTYASIMVGKCDNLNLMMPKHPQRTMPQEGPIHWRQVIIVIVVLFCFFSLFPNLPDDNLYSATSMNFLGSEPVVMRSSSISIRTEFKSYWLNGIPTHTT